MCRGVVDLSVWTVLKEEHTGGQRHRGGIDMMIATRMPFSVPNTSTPAKASSVNGERLTYSQDLVRRTRDALIATSEVRDVCIRATLVLERILPNHACATAAQHPEYRAVQADGRVETWPRFYGW